MSSGLRRLVAVAATLALLAAVATAGAVEVAKARPTAGTSTISRDGHTTNVGASTEFREGDTLRVPSDGDRLVIEFADGASISLVGPAGLRFGPMSEKGRRVVLAYGAASEIVVRGVALEIQTPTAYDSSLVLQNARAFARVSPGNLVTFQKIEGSYAKVYRGSQSTDLGSNAWKLNVRDGVVSMDTSGKPAAGAGAGAGAGNPRSALSEQAVGTDGIRIKMGGKNITFSPAKGFSREALEDEGLKLTFHGGEDDWGTVEVGLQTTLFLADGQSIDFDKNGNITRTNGIAHMLRQVLDVIMNDNPIETGTDASPSYTKNR